MPRKLDLPVLRRPVWPAADQAEWQAACRTGDWFDDGGALGRVDARRLRPLEAAYGRRLGFLATTEPDGQIPSGVPFLTRERVRTFYDRLGDALAPYTVRYYLSDLWTVVRTLAPDQPVAPLAAATRYIQMTATPVTDPLARLVPARDLFALGLDLMRTAPACACATPLQEIGRYRDGLMIALLAACPLRLGNLAAIELDRHLTKPADTYRLAFATREVKNRRPLEYPLPGALTPWIDRYLAQYRPILLGRRGRWSTGDPGGALWVSRDATKMRPGRIRERLMARTRERFGFPINPHRVRHIAITSTAAEIPQHIGIAQAVLGHTGPRTAERYYNQAHSPQAARRYQAVIDALLTAQEEAS